MAGGLLAASGMLLASLDLSLPWMYLSLGILQGDNLKGVLVSPQEMLQFGIMLYLSSVTLLLQ